LTPDVAIVGGGIVGTAAAALLAEAGASVELFEREELAAAASGRNSGSVQHPYDHVLAGLYDETLALYRRLARADVGFDLPEPAGILLLSPHRAPLEAIAAGIARDCPVLDPTLVEGRELEQLEPALAPGLVACQIATGRPVRPASATLAFAELARRAGASLREHAAAAPWVEDGRVHGVVTGGERRPAGAVLVAAGPWTPRLVDPSGEWRPIVPVWGVNVEVALERPPRHVLEEAGLEDLVGPDAPSSLFSLVSTAGTSVLGSTFLPEEPQPQRLAPELRRRATSFVPELERAPVVSVRACPRPQSLDGRPLLGRVPGVEALWVAAGHGPLGISTGPAAARLVAGAILGQGCVWAELEAGRAGLARRRDG
jgi:glycine/D-amino acid oxidase-like deaminating enzyme